MTTTLRPQPQRRTFPAYISIFSMYQCITLSFINQKHHILDSIVVSISPCHLQTTRRRPGFGKFNPSVTLRVSLLTFDRFPVWELNSTALSFCCFLREREQKRGDIGSGGVLPSPLLSSFSIIIIFILDVVTCYASLRCSV
jgi:hypothetical protein